MRLALALILFFPIALQAANIAQCLRSALIDLHNQPLLDQQSAALADKNLIPQGSSSMLCGPTCGSYLMEAIRTALKIPSAYPSMAAEIESLTKVGFFLGNDVTRNGMSLYELRAAILGDIAQHGVVAEAEVHSLRVEKPLSGRALKSVSEIKVRDLQHSTDAAELSIIQVEPIFSAEFGHYFLVQKIDTERKLIWLIDPLRPHAPRIVSFTEHLKDNGKLDLQLGSPPTHSVRGFLKIKLPTS